MRKELGSLNLKPNQTALYYIGQMGILACHNGSWLMIDGYLSDYVDRNCCTPQVQWKRKYAPPLEPRELDFIDFVFCTHAHFDHTDPYTIAGLAAVNSHARFLAPPPAADLIEKTGIEPERIIRVRPGETYRLNDEISAVAFPAAHEELHPDGAGNYAEVGYSITLGDFVLCHTGDCCPYDGLAEQLKGCDALIAPINGRDEYRTKVLDIIGCFDADEALTLAEQAGAGLFIPAHYDLYDVNGADPAEFEACRASHHPAQACKLFAPGEGRIFG